MADIKAKEKKMLQELFGFALDFLNKMGQNLGCFREKVGSRLPVQEDVGINLKIDKLIVNFNKLF